MSERGVFSGKLGFIIATAGSAVGLGNIWRFPTVAATHGGGTFLLVYLIIVAVFGLAMLCTEIALGRMTRRSAIDAYCTLDKRGKIIGILETVVPAIIYPYYCVIGGWIIGYMFSYLIGCNPGESSFFGDFVSSWWAVAATVAFMSIVAVFVYLGVNKGIERMSKIVMPLFLLLLIILVIYVLTLPGMMDGFVYFVEPKFDNISMDTFTSALGQAFYSLSLAMGISITYGSYMKKQENLQKSVSSIIIIDTAIAILAGLLVVPMAFHSFGADMPGGAGLAFVSLPGIFDGMPAGFLVAVVFFVMLFIAALTSAVSINEAVVAAIMDHFHVARHRAVLLVTIPSLVVGCIIAMGFGPLDWISLGDKGLLDIFDYVANNLLMPIGAFLMCLFVGHLVGPKLIIDEIESSGEFALKKVYPVLIKWVFPIIVFLILVSGIING